MSYRCTKFIKLCSFESFDIVFRVQRTNYRLYQSKKEGNVVFFIVSGWIVFVKQTFYRKNIFYLYPV